jgi:hypothetical protein
MYSIYMCCFIRSAGLNLFSLRGSISSFNNVVASSFGWAVSLSLYLFDYKMLFLHHKCCFLQDRQCYWILNFVLKILSTRYHKQALYIFRIIAFMNVIHYPGFQINRKHIVSETGSVSVCRWGAGDTCLGVYLE